MHEERLNCCVGSLWWRGLILQKKIPTFLPDLIALLVREGRKTRRAVYIKRLGFCATSTNLLKWNVYSSIPNKRPSSPAHFYPQFFLLIWLWILEFSQTIVQMWFGWFLRGACYLVYKSMPGITWDMLSSTDRSFSPPYLFAPFFSCSKRW